MIKCSHNVRKCPNYDMEREVGYSMDRRGFLDILESQLTGQMHEGKIAAHLRYYEDYIQSQVMKGRSEQDVLNELGDPRLIARTLLDTDTDNGNISYEEYSTEDSGFSGDSYSEDKRQVHSFQDKPWYEKLISLVIFVGILSVLIRMIGRIMPSLVMIALGVYVISFLFRRR